MADLPITVLVVAHRRSRYVIEALDSVVGQELDPNRFEIVLCTDAVDPALDRWLEEHPGRRLMPPDGNWGEWLLAALPRCRGDILCFLDDDDLFLPTKLAVVRAAFDAHPSLGYYHNRVERFYQPGASSRRDRPGALGRPVGPGGGVVPAGEKSGDRVTRLFWQMAGFNASAIAVRRSVIETNGSLWSELEIGHPLAMFYAAACGPWDLYLDPQVLTRYRVHAQNWSVTPAGGPAFQWQKAARDAPVVARDARRIAEYVDRAGRGRLSSTPVRAVGARAELVQSLVDPQRRRGSVLRAAAHYVALTPPRVLPGQKALIGLTGLSLLDPRAPDRWLRARVPG